MAKASRISARAALAIFRSSVSGWSVTRPSASEMKASASRRSFVTPSSVSTRAARSSSEFGRPSLMDQRLYGSRLHGVAIGLLSTGAGLAVAELVAGLDREASSPVVSVGQEIIDIVPPGVKDWAIDTFGTADKLALVLGTVFSLAVIGSIVGILAVTGRRMAAYAVTSAVGLIGAWAVTMRPDPTFAKLLPAIAGTLASIGCPLVPGAAHEPAARRQCRRDRSRAPGRPTRLPAGRRHRRRHLARRRRPRPRPARALRCRPGAGSARHPRA